MKLYLAVQDKELMDELKGYFDLYFREEAVNILFGEGNEMDLVFSAKQAKQMVDKAFENIELQFAPQTEAKEPINEAR